MNAAIGSSTGCSTWRSLGSVAVSGTDVSASGVASLASVGSPARRRTAGVAFSVVLAAWR